MAGWSQIAGLGMMIGGRGLEGRANKQAWAAYEKRKREAQGVTASRIEGTESQMRTARGDADQFKEYMRNALAAREGRVNPLMDTLSPERLTEMYDLARSPVEIGEQAGFSPEAIAAMRGQAIDAVPARFDDAMRQAKIAASRRGLAYTPGLGQILAAKEATRAGALRDITIQNEEQRLKNIENARKFGLSQRQLQLGGMGDVFGQGSNLLGQIGNLYNPAPYISGYGSAMGGVSSLAGTAMQGADIYGRQVTPLRDNPSTWGPMLSSAGGALAGMNLGGGGGSTPNPGGPGWGYGVQGRTP